MYNTYVQEVVYTLDIDKRGPHVKQKRRRLLPENALFSKIKTI